MRRRLQGRCAAWPVKASSSRTLLALPLLHAYLMAFGNSHISSSSHLHHLLQGTSSSLSVFETVSTSKYVSVFTSGRGSSCSHCLEVQRPQGRRCQTKIYLLASCRLEANCQNRDTDRVFHVLLPPHFLSVSVELFWEPSESSSVKVHFVFVTGLQHKAKRKLVG